MKKFIIIFCFLLACSAQAAKQPNIVFFFADDQTSSSLACYGHPLAKTPNIDRLAARGTRFSNSYVSQAICWVSRTTILTGLTGRSYGTPGRHDAARPDAVRELYVDLLRKSGYRTGFAGKWHAKMPKGWKAADHFDVFQPIGRNPFYKKQPDGSLRHETELIVDRGIEFLENQPKDKPFALNMWFNACHAEDGDRRPGIGHFPWPRAVDNLYVEDEIAPPRLNDPKIFESQPYFLKTTINRERFFWRWNTETKYRTNMRAYLRMVSGIDNAIGRFIKALEAKGLADNTIIVYMSDAPDTHHSTGYEWPLAIVGNLKGKMNLGGRYINFPGYGKPGHHTVGALYTTFLNCVGQPQQTFGRLDPDLDEKAMQTGPLAQLMT